MLHRRYGAYMYICMHMYAHICIYVICMYVVAAATTLIGGKFGLYVHTYARFFASTLLSSTMTGMYVQLWAANWKRYSSKFVPFTCKQVSKQNNIRLNKESKHKL